ncbi:DUF192 domain-containing protein [Tumebacillus flagellatus]|uniref:DUF192 domain-containing protein n=1 Tax=Tumebacillus flagellatus TaxID=1157490 RepID=A0A074M7J0_9BACL|nr:DUF192 domain-containing protein [Tumebacillus flagellatus]KEO81967.1 hypothetical protein EL26_17495 [Tumebacillus flagellatus]
MLEVWNQSLGVRLAWEVEMAASFWRRLRGWIGRRNMPIGAALVIQSCNGIHTFFMKEEIDVAFLDAEQRIVHLLHRVKPNYLAPFVRGATHVIEFPAGTLSASGTQVRDRLVLETERSGESYMEWLYNQERGA